MREIKSYIMNYMMDKSLSEIEDYICSFLQDGEITDNQCNALLEWAEKWCEIR